MVDKKEAKKPVKKPTAKAKPKPKANPVGRPRTTLADLPEDWKDIITKCGTDGGSATEVRCLLGIGESAWATLLEDYPEFQRAEKERIALCEVWWERQGRRMTTDGQGNATVWIFNMKNRFGWRDKQEVDHTSSDASMSPPKSIEDFYKK
jgi:hypothetical protein